MALPNPASSVPWKIGNPRVSSLTFFDRDFALSLQQFGVPIINVTLTLGELPFPVVDVDHLEVGKIAADYFMQKGYHSFAYFGSNTAMFSKARERGFREQLAMHDHTVNSHYAGFLPQSPWNINWAELDSSVSEWLVHLPKPVAILASNDIPARHLASTCRKLGIRVPEEISILGVDNDDSECRMTNPFLSSIALPTRAIGIRAGEILHEALRSKQYPRADIISIPPVGVIDRQSTDQLAVNNTKLEEALRWIQENIDQNPSVQEIARKLSLSRRSLERLFQMELGTSVLQFQIRCKLEKAKSLLRLTELPLHEIAERSGFCQPTFFHRYLSSAGTSTAK